MSLGHLPMPGGPLSAGELSAWAPDRGHFHPPQRDPASRLYLHLCQHLVRHTHSHRCPAARPDGTDRKQNATADRNVGVRGRGADTGYQARTFKEHAQIREITEKLGQ